MTHEASENMDMPFFKLWIIGCGGRLYVQRQLVTLERRCHTKTHLQWPAAAQNFDLEVLYGFSAADF